MSVFSDSVDSVYDHSTSGTNILYEEENVGEYRPGGYLPTLIGQTFNDGRYKVLNKAGFTGDSTTWIASDDREGRVVALKALSAARTSYSQEVASLHTLRYLSGGLQCRGGLVKLLDKFGHVSSNGYHQCLVFEMYGPPVDIVLGKYRDANVPFLGKKIFDFTISLLQTIALMHTAGWTHGGMEIKDVVTVTPWISALNQENVHQYVSTLGLEELTRSDGSHLGDGIPPYLVRSAKWTYWPEPASEQDFKDVQIINLDKSFHKDTYRFVVPATVSAASLISGDTPPEHIFDKFYGLPADLWRAGMIIYHMIFGRPLFAASGIEKLVAGMIAYFGPLPAQWQEQWAYMTALNPNQSSMAEGGLTLGPQPSLARHFEDLDDAKLRALQPVVDGLMRLRPEDRLSALDALEMVYACEFSFLSNGHSIDPPR